MTGLSLVQWIFAGSITVLGGTLALAVFWWFDQKRDWFVLIEGGDIDWKKLPTNRGTVSVYDNEDNRAEVPLDPAKSRYKKGLRAGRAYVIDVDRGEQIDPSRPHDGQMPGYELGAITDARLHEQWFRGFPKTGLQNFWAEHGTLLIIVGGIVGVVFVWRVYGGAL